MAIVNECVPLYDNGDDPVTVHLEAAALGKRFVSISDDLQSGPGLNSATDGGNIVVSQSTAGQKAFGVLDRDRAQDTKGKVFGDGNTVPVTAGGSVTAGDKVTSDSVGRAVTHDPDGTFATLATGVVGSNNAITWTSRLIGTDGEEITVTIIDPAGNNASLSVDVDGRDIVVSLATDGASAPTSTAAQVIAAVQEHDQASQLVDVANTGASSGAGVVAAVAETALDGGVDVGEVNGTAISDGTLNADVFVRLSL